MPIMTMHDVKKDKTYTSKEWLSFEELAKEAWVDFPKAPSFKSVEVKKKKASKKTEDLSESKE